MVRYIILTLWLLGCSAVSNDTPKLGKQVEAPYGWKYTYCLNHRNEIGCSNEE